MYSSYDQMVLIETVVTGFVDEFPSLGKNACIRLMTTISVCILFFLAGIASTTQVLASHADNMSKTSYIQITEFDLS